MNSIIKTHVQTDRPITLHGRNGHAHGHLVDLSTKGIGVLSDRGAKEGTELQAEFEIPALGRFVTLRPVGKVIHRHNSGDYIYLTIRFDGLSDEEKEAIEDFIDFKTRLSQLGKSKLSD
jgi:hypothetical protein